MAQPTRLSAPTRGLLRLKHGIRMGGQVVRFAAAQRFWWLIPVVIILSLAAIALSITSTALPVTVYTLF